MARQAPRRNRGNGEAPFTATGRVTGFPVQAGPFVTRSSLRTAIVILRSVCLASPGTLRTAARSARHPKVPVRVESSDEGAGHDSAQAPCPSGQGAGEGAESAGGGPAQPGAGAAGAAAAGPGRGCGGGRWAQQAAWSPSRRPQPTHGAAPLPSSPGRVCRLRRVGLSLRAMDRGLPPDHYLQERRLGSPTITYEADTRKGKR